MAENWNEGNDVTTLFGFDFNFDWGQVTFPNGTTYKSISLPARIKGEAYLERAQRSIEARLEVVGRFINRVANSFAQIYIGAALRKQRIEIGMSVFSGVICVRQLV